MKKYLLKCQMKEVRPDKKEKRAETNLHRCLSTITLLLLCSIVLLNFVPHFSEVTASSKKKYTIERVDHSIKNDKDEVIGKFYYDKVILDGESKAVKKINKALEKQCDAFFKEYEENFTEYVQIGWDMYGSDLVKEPFFCTMESKVTYNKNDLFSICQNSDWMAGGVRNMSTTGLNYSTKTGKQVLLTDVVEGKAKAVKKKAIAATKKQLLKDGYQEDDFFKQMMSIPNGYSTDDFKFYLKGEKVYLCYECYELGNNDSVVAPMSRK